MREEVEEEGNLGVVFDFAASQKLERKILDKIDDFMLYEGDRAIVQEYKTEKDAFTVWDFVTDSSLPGFIPAPPPFEIDGWWYNCWLPLGKQLLTLWKDDLFTSGRMYDGKSEVLFITDLYKGIIRDLINLLYFVKDKNIRYSMDLKHVYTNNFIRSGCFANFTRFDVQEGTNNELDLLIDIKRLLVEINHKWCNTGSYKAEFDLLLQNLTLKEQLNKVFHNAIFWTKAGRMEFLKGVIEVSNTHGFKMFNGDVHSIAVVETFCGFSSRDPRKIFFVKWMNLLYKKFPIRRMSCEMCMRYLIEVIIHVYDILTHHNTRSSEERIHRVGEVDAIEFKNGDSFVEFIQYTFPTLIGGLAERVKKENWPLVMKAECLLPNNHIIYSDFGTPDYVTT